MLFTGSKTRKKYIKNHSPAGCYSPSPAPLPLWLDARQLLPNSDRSIVRYLKASILIGCITALVVGLFFELGVLRAADLRLGSFLGLRFSPAAGRAEQYPLFLFFAFAIAWTTVDIPKNSLKAVVALGAFVELITAVWVCDKLGVFLSPFAAGLAILLSFALSFLYAQGSAGSRKRIVRTIFADRISTRSFATLVNTDVPLNFDGELREGTVVVCEIFNHDQLADALPVADYVALNNSFLRNAAEILVEQGGYLDECDGESLRVIFGVPRSTIRATPSASPARRLWMS